MLLWQHIGKNKNGAWVVYCLLLGFAHRTLVELGCCVQKPTPVALLVSAKILVDDVKILISAIEMQTGNF